MNECKQLSARRVSLILAAFQNDVSSDKRWAERKRQRDQEFMTGKEPPWDWGEMCIEHKLITSPSFLPSPLSFLNRPPLWSNNSYISIQLARNHQGQVWCPASAPPTPPEGAGMVRGGILYHLQKH